MSLQAVYQSFLSCPKSTALAEDASFNYISTLTTISNAAAIVKHLSTQENILKQKQEKPLSCIESPDAICLEVETTLEFLNGGGAFLPGLDDNFIADQKATLPIIHIVQFDSSQKIQQVRLYWDQGSLLKLVDVIGSRAKNWPIRDGKDQVRLITSSVAGTAKSIESASRKVTAPGSTAPVSPTKSKDPHTSLHLLFTPREVKERDSSNTGPAVPPRASAKPPPREYHEIFAGNDSDASPASKAKKSSPRKETQNPIAPKGGAGKNFQASRLFGADESSADSPAAPDSPTKGVKAHSTNYSHFEFGDVSDTANKRPAAKVRNHDRRHFDVGNDDANIDSPIKIPPMGQPRRGIEKQFDMNDDSSSVGDGRPATHSRGQGSRNTATSLYQNNVHNDTVFGSSSTENKTQPLASTAINPKDRRRDFDPHFEIADSGPGNGNADVNGSGDNTEKAGSEGQSRANKTMDAQREVQDDEPETGLYMPSNSQRGKENYSTVRTGGIRTAGNGMGGRKENNGIFGDGDIPVQVQKGGIRTAGNGMGGRKGTGRNWGFGDEGY